MQWIFAALASAAIVMPAAAAAAGPVPAQAGSAPGCGRVAAFPGADWGPEQPGQWDRSRLAKAKALWESLDSAAVVVVHQGRPVALWGEVNRNFTAQSVRKALLNSLVGVAVAKGHLSLDDSMAKLGIDDSQPSLTEIERSATVRDLLMSRSGIFHSALYEVGGWKKLRAQLAEEKSNDAERFRPGSYWVYNNWDFNALGSIVEQSLGQPIGKAFDRFIAGPTGMQDFRAANVEYTSKTDPTEQRFSNWSDHRAYVIDISTRDLARYGLLNLACGRWKGRQVLPRDWVLASIKGVDTRIGRAANDRQTGFGDYGYLWQIDRPANRRLANLQLRQPIYMASGNRGHFMIVAPALDLVIAHQVATVGGVSTEAQKRRFLEGSPEVSEEDLGRLFAAIIAAHPDAAEAFGDSPPPD